MRPSVTRSSVAAPPAAGTSAGSGENAVSSDGSIVILGCSTGGAAGSLLQPPVNAATRTEHTTRGRSIGKDSAHGDLRRGPGGRPSIALEAARAPLREAG